MTYQLRWLRKDLPKSLPLGAAVPEAASSAPIMRPSIAEPLLSTSVLEGTPSVQYNPVEFLETKSRATVALEERLGLSWIASQWSDLCSTFPLQNPAIGSNNVLNASGDIFRDGPEGESIRSQGRRASGQGLASFAAATVDGYLVPLRGADHLNMSRTNSITTSRHTSMKSFKRHKSYKHGGASRASLAVREEGERLRIEEQLHLLEEESSCRKEVLRAQQVTFIQLTRLDFYNPLYDDVLVEKPIASAVLENALSSSQVLARVAEEPQKHHPLGRAYSIATTNQITECHRQLAVVGRALCIGWVEEFEERKKIFTTQKAEWQDLIAATSPFSSYHSRRAGQYEASGRMLKDAEGLSADLLAVHEAQIAQFTRDRAVALQRLSSKSIAELLLNMARWHPLTLKRERLERARIIAHYHPSLLPFSGPHRTADLAVWWGMWIKKGQHDLNRKKQRQQVVAMTGRSATMLVRRRWDTWKRAKDDGTLLRALGIIRMTAEDSLRLVYLDRFRLFIERICRRHMQQQRVAVLGANAQTELTFNYYRKWLRHHRQAPNRAALTAMTNANVDRIRRRYLMQNFMGFVMKRRMSQIAAKAAEELKLLNLQLKNCNIVRKVYFGRWRTWTQPKAHAKAMIRAAEAEQEEALLLAEVKRQMEQDRLRAAAEDGS